MRLKRLRYSFSAILAGFKVLPRSYYTIVFLALTNFCLTVTLLIALVPKLFVVWLKFGLVAPKFITLLVLFGSYAITFCFNTGCGVFLPSSASFKGTNLDDLTLFC